MDRPRILSISARDQLNRRGEKSLFSFAPENLVLRDGFGRPVLPQSAQQAESGAFSRHFFYFPRRRPYIIPPIDIGSVPSLSGHTNAYRWRSLPRVRRHRASSPQGSSSNINEFFLFRLPFGAPLFPHTQ